MRNLLVLIPLLLFACQKEIPVHPEANQSTLKSDMSQQEVLDFLVQHENESFSPDVLADIQEILKEPEWTDFSRSNNIIEVPAGSVDALQSAVDEAGPGGTVKLLAGEHIENQMVRIEHTIKLLGAKGAILRMDNPILPTTPGQVIPGIYFKNAPKSLVKGIEFRPVGDASGAAIILESSKETSIIGNKFYDFQFSINIEKSDRVKIMHNQITGTPLWLDGTVSDALGITVINGKQTSIINNQVSTTIFGIWPCDRGAVSWGNTTTGNFIGQLLCRVPPESFVTPDGDAIGADFASNHVLMAMNTSTDNFFAGYVAIDGANKNILLGNKASGNANYDIELVGDSERFGFFTPTSVKNTVYSFPDLTIKDCGDKNRVFGGIEVDISEDPCF